MVSNDSRAPVASLSNNAAQIASVKSQQASTPSVDDSHGVVPVAVTSDSSVIPLSQVDFLTTKTRAPSAVPLGRGLSSGDGNPLFQRRRP